MTDIDTNTAIVIAAITAISAIIGASIGSVTNYLIERQRNSNEEKRRQQEENTKELSLRYQAYIQFLSIKESDVYTFEEDKGYLFNSDSINEIYAPVILYGSPKVSSSLAKTFPPKSWESILAAKKILTGELVLEKGGNLSSLIKEVKTTDTTATT
jgi:hypothetical protein